MYVQHVPELVGARFEECAFRWGGWTLLAASHATVACAADMALPVCW
jgi:hypothetical protein